MVLTPIIGTVLNILMLIAVFGQLRSGNSQAVVYAAGWLFLTAGIWLKVIEVYLSFSGNTYTNFFLRHGFSIGWFAQVVCMSILLVQRIYRTNKEKDDLNHQIIQLDKMVSIGMITSMVSHEIKNPLSAILSNSEFLREYFSYLNDLCDSFTKDKESVRIGNFEYGDFFTRYARALEDTIKCCYRIDDTIEHLRKFYRKTNIVSISELSLNDVVAEAMYLLSHKIHKAQADARIEYASDLPAVNGNFQALEQVVVNLLLNACQALESRSGLQGRIGLISLKTVFDETSRMNILYVRDTGAGMDPKALDRIAEPFFTTKGEGSGLGLYISKEIIKNHGGDIVFNSEPGVGTEVKVLLPVSSGAIKGSIASN